MNRKPTIAQAFCENISTPDKVRYNIPKCLYSVQFFCLHIQYLQWQVRLLVYRDANLQMSLLDPTQIYNMFELELTKVR